MKSMLLYSLELCEKYFFYPNRNENICIIVMNKKLKKCMCMPNVLACLSQPERTY